MYAYDSRRPRDVPPSSSNRYRDTGLYDDYAQPARSSRPSRYQDPEPRAAPPSHDRHRRKSVSAPQGQDDLRPHRRANVVASDDGRSPRDAYGSAYPERTSRHDVEAKTSERNRQFREQRRGYETEEADKLRRAKSHSPRRAAREEMPRKSSPQINSKSTWADDAYGADPYQRSSAKPARGGQQYYGEDAYGGGRGKARDTGKDYYGGGASSSAAMPRPPAGDYAPYKSSPLSSAGSADNNPLPKHHHSSSARDPPPRAAAAKPTPSYGTPYPDYSNEAAAAASPPRRSRSTRVPDHTSKPTKSAGGGGAYDDYGSGGGGGAYAQHRGRDRPPPTRSAADYDDDPYERPPPRARQRQSMPPPSARGRGYNAPEYDDQPTGSYGAAGPRRAASVNHHGRGAYDEGPGGRYAAEERAGRGRVNTAGAGAKPATSAQKQKQKQWGKQAGSLFMKHAVPVIKQEAVPFLTKAAQAYMQGKGK